MTPKEKANELISRFIGISLSQVNDLVDGIRFSFAKQSALITVDEILKSGISVDYYFDDSVGYYISYQEYYEEVKQEIELL